jgi:anaerobic selenocysteine-containing dehydrogenase
MSSTTEVRGCCPLDCQDTCAWVVEVEDGRVVRVRGDKEHPITRGALCAKVNDYQAKTYAEDRLLHPLIRAGEKGRGVFRRATWDEAVDLVAERFREIIETSGPEALLPHSYLGSMGVVQRYALNRLFHALGASRQVGNVCGQAMAVVGFQGHPIGFDPQDMVEAEFVLVWGSNPLSTSHHTWHFTAEARRLNGARLICIDPIRTRTARACDEHIAIRPGTDWMLAAGMARILLEEGLGDVEYASRVAVDLDAYREVVAPWTPDRVAEVCGIEAATVVRLAREFGGARPALIRAGVGLQQSVAGEAVMRALSSLAILGGHWQHPGGGLYAAAFPAFNGASAARPDLVTGEPRSLDMARLGRTLTDRTLDPPVEGLMVWGTNPATIQIDAGRVRQGLARDDLFTVVVEHFLTDTARYADVVLPSTTQLEHFDLQGAWGHHYITVNLPAVEPVGEARTHGDILRGLATAMGLEHAALHESDRQIAAAALPDDLALDELVEAGWVKRSPRKFLVPRQDRRLPLANGGAPPIPDRPDGQLQLLTPKPHHFLNSTFANMERQRRAMGQPTLYLHPVDAEALRLPDGAEVEVATDLARVRATVTVSDEVLPGVVMLPGKWWSRDVGEAGINGLTPPTSSRGGQPAYNDTFVTVTSAPELSIEVPNTTVEEATR